MKNSPQKTSVKLKFEKIMEKIPTNTELEQIINEQGPLSSIALIELQERRKEQAMQQRPVQGTVAQRVVDDMNARKQAQMMGIAQMQPQINPDEITPEMINALGRPKPTMMANGGLIGDFGGFQGDDEALEEYLAQMERGLEGGSAEDYVPFSEQSFPQRLGGFLADPESREDMVNIFKEDPKRALGTGVGLAALLYNVRRGKIPTVKEIKNVLDPKKASKIDPKDLAGPKNKQLVPVKKPSLKTFGERAAMMSSAGRLADQDPNLTRGGFSNIFGNRTEDVFDKFKTAIDKFAKDSPQDDPPKDDPPKKGEDKKSKGLGSSLNPLLTILAGDAIRRGKPTEAQDFLKTGQAIQASKDARALDQEKLDIAREELGIKRLTAQRANALTSKDFLTQRLKFFADDREVEKAQKAALKDMQETVRVGFFNSVPDEEDIRNDKKLSKRFNELVDDNLNINFAQSIFQAQNPLLFATGKMLPNMFQGFTIEGQE